MASGSRFEELAKAKKAKIDMLNDGVEDVVKQKQLEAKLARMDSETNQRIEEVKNEPVNTELIKAQAKAYLESTKKANARDKANTIAFAEESVQRYKDALKKAEDNLVLARDTAEEFEESQNLKATQEYDRLVASAGNAEQTLKLRIDKIKQQAEMAKRDIQIELDTITIRNDAKKDSLKEIDALYNDMKEVSIKVNNSN